MDNTYEIGVIRAENTVEIGFDDIFKGKGNYNEPFDHHFDSNPFEDDDDPFEDDDDPFKDDDDPFEDDDDPFEDDDDPFEDDDDSFDVRCNDVKLIPKKTDQIKNKKIIVPESNNLSKNPSTVADFESNEDLLDHSTKNREVENTLNENIASSRTDQVVKKTYTIEKQPTTKKISASIVCVKDNEYRSMGYQKYHCNHCHFITTSKIFVKKHIMNIHRERIKIYQCLLCPFKSRYDSMRHHVKSRHTSETEMKWYRCGQCDSKFKVKSSLRAHIFTHMDTSWVMDQMKKCNLCPKMFKTSLGLKKHKKYFHEKNTVSKLKCLECDYESTLNLYMKDHIAAYHSNVKDLETLKCPECSYTTKLQHKIRNHIHFRHSKNKIQCEKCGYQTMRKEGMKLHMLNHKEVKDEKDLKYRCDKCDYKSIRQYSLQIHKLNHLKPEEIQYFYCYHCQFKAKRKDNLKTHVLRHFKQNEVPFQCSICNFNTKKRDVLIRHIDKHSKSQNETTAQTVKVISSVNKQSRLIKNLKNKVNPSLDKKLKMESLKLDEVNAPLVDKVKEMKDFKTDAASSVDRTLEETEAAKIILRGCKRSERIKNRKIKRSPSLDKKSKKKDSQPDKRDTRSVTKKEDMEDFKTPSLDGPLKETKITSPVSKRSKRIADRHIKVSPSLDNNLKKTKGTKLAETDKLSVSKKEDIMQDVKTDVTPSVDGSLNVTKQIKEDKNHLKETKKDKRIRK